jgi:outer membrane protein TolC
LHYVEAHNPQLRAGRSQADTQKQLNRAGNNLPDPTISYSHLWAEKGSGESIGELIVSQQFDFPTLYAARSNVNRLKADALDADYDLLRQQILLQARELCIDLLRLQQQEVLLSERLKQTEALERLYQKRLANGDANILEVNKLNLELLNARTELQTYRIEWKNARIALLALCDQGNLSEQPSQAWQIADETLPTLPADSLGLLERL